MDCGCPHVCHHVSHYPKGASKSAVLPVFCALVAHPCNEEPPDTIQRVCAWVPFSLITGREKPAPMQHFGKPREPK
jgi:hypothetical protein